MERDVPGGPDGRPADAVLVAQLAGGHEDALAVLYDRHAAEVYRTALRVSGDSTTAEEVVQETFLTLWNRAALFEPERGSLGGWLATIARHRAIDRHRTAARQPAVAPFSAIAGAEHDDTLAEWLVTSGVAVVAGSADEPPDVTVARREAAADIGLAMARLTPEERASILLAYRDGLSQAEIAARLGWPLGTVKTRSRRALRRLRAVLEPATEQHAVAAGP